MEDRRIIFDMVSKKFGKGYASDSLRDAAVMPFKRLFGKNGRVQPDHGAAKAANWEKGEFWALRDVSFDVKPGEALGIIGLNGSGKSTTLKLLARILRPDGGKIFVKGRVGALIELGAGFHPDLTGKENVFLNGSILGMSKDEIRRKYDDIVDFAELPNFMDTPVKWYSSGMHARLGFAVAAYTDPDVLLVDEVLSVGDVGFQQKCEKRIQNIKENGLVIVFVSHNMSAIGALCDKVLVLDQGRIVYFGDTDDAINRYADLYKAKHVAKEDKVIFLEASIRDEEGNSKLSFIPGERCCVSFAFKAADELEKINLGIRIRKKESSFIVFGSNYSTLTGKRLSLSKDQEAVFALDLTLNLLQGTYVLEVVIWDQVKDRPLLIKEISTFIMKDLFKSNGVAFLHPVIRTFSIK